MPSHDIINLNTPLVVITPESARHDVPREKPSEHQAALQTDTQQEDPVTLSSRQTSQQTAGNRNKPSLPVSPDEKKSLLNTKKKGHSFSVYG